MTSSQTLIDQDLAQFGWVESIGTNSISDFKNPYENTETNLTGLDKFSLVDIFICHMVFYVIFCYSLFIFVVIDLGFGSFLKNKITTIMETKIAPLFFSRLN